MTTFLNVPDALLPIVRIREDARSKVANGVITTSISHFLKSPFWAEDPLHRRQTLGASTATPAKVAKPSNPNVIITVLKSLADR